MQGVKKSIQGDSCEGCIARKSGQWMRRLPYLCCAESLQWYGSEWGSVLVTVARCGAEEPLRERWDVGEVPCSSSLTEES